MKDASLATILAALALLAGCLAPDCRDGKFTLVDPEKDAVGRMTALPDGKLQALRRLTDARIAQIRATPNMEIPDGAARLYLSEKTGDDAADGKTPQTAWKTIARLNKAAPGPGTYVLFERGGLYRGCVMAKPGVTYTAWGEGPKPRIYGSPEDGADPAKWERTENPRVWAYRIGHDDVGTLVFDGGAAHAIKIVIRTDRKTGAKFNKYTGRPFNSYRDLDGDLHFWHDYYKGGTGKVYLYSERNPGERFRSIEFNVKTCGFRVGGAADVTIDNFTVKYVGIHGVSAGTCRNLAVRNCEFAWIGGSIQGEALFGRDHPTRLGNGVEIYGGCDNYVVDNCYLWQVYDAAITQQVGVRSAEDLKMQRKMRYSNNVMEKCNYSIEYFLSRMAKYPQNPSRMEDFLIENNLMWDAATGFCEQRPDLNCGAHVKSWRNGSNRATRYRIRNNLFAGSREMLIEVSSGLLNPDGSDSMPTLEGNLFIGKKGQRFGVLNQGKPAELAYDDALAGKLDARHVDNVFYMEK